MAPPAPPFPAFEDWKRMSEREQDALLDRMEAHKHRSAAATRLLIGLGCVGAVLAAGFAALALLYL